MFPKYNQQEWLSIVATCNADDIHTATSTLSGEFGPSTSALPASTNTDAGGWLAYAAITDKGRIKLLYSGDS